MEKKGIDISHHQGDIDFEKLKGNIDFAMVRTSYGSFYEDRKYKQNIKGLEKINVPYGLYHFSYATDVETAKKEASSFINLIKNYNPTYPVVIDIEYSDRTADVRKDTLVDIANVFCKMVEEAGYYAMIYANLDYFNNKLNSNVLDRYDKWLAQWTSKPTYNKPFGIWQYSSKGSVPGINGNPTYYSPSNRKVCFYYYNDLIYGYRSENCKTSFLFGKSGLYESYFTSTLDNFLDNAELLLIFTSSQLL